MNTNISNFENNEYLSVENLQILIDNITGYLNKAHTNKFDYDKIDLNRLFYENMMGIIKSKDNYNKRYYRK